MSSVVAECTTVTRLSCPIACANSDNELVWPNQNKRIVERSDLCLANTIVLAGTRVLAVDPKRGRTIFELRELFPCQLSEILAHVQSRLAQVSLEHGNAKFDANVEQDWLQLETEPERAFDAKLVSALDDWINSHLPQWLRGDSDEQVVEGARRVVSQAVERGAVVGLLSAEFVDDILVDESDVSRRAAFAASQSVLFGSGSTTARVLRDRTWPVPVPAEWLARVFEKVRAALQLGSELLAEIRQEHWQTTTFHPSSDGGDHYPNEASEHLRWCRELFDRLANEQPDIARDELRRWPIKDQYFFDKLRIYAWSYKSLFSATEVADGLVGLWQEGFWNEYHRRELLHTLRARWADFGLEDRRRVEARVILGPPAWVNEDSDSLEQRKLRTACTLLGWLDRHGCELSSESQKVLSALREMLPEWHASREERADSEP